MEVAELEAWAESVAGVDVASTEPVGYGSSNLTWFVNLEDGRQWVARVDTGHGPTAGTELDLVRQAHVLRALADHQVRSPGLVALHPDGTTMLMERAPGTHELPTAGSPEREAVLDDYIDALGELHCLDVATLGLVELARPSAPQDHARNDLAIWQRIYEARRRRRHPLVEFTFALLHDLAPPAVARTVVCHGDVGPGNFLHAGGRVTALVDWEFAHVGDPMDDLAWWVFRGHDMSGDAGDLGAQLQRWSSVTGLAVDPAAIEYYRAFVMLRWLVCAIATVETGGPAIDRSVHNRLMPLIGALLPRSLARVLGVDLTPTPPSSAHHPLGMAPVLETMQADLTEFILPAIGDPALQQRVSALSGYVGHLAAVDRIGAAVADENARDLAKVVNTDDEDQTADAFASLAHTNAETALATLAAVGDRTIQLWPGLAARPAAGLVDIPTLGAAGNGPGVGGEADTGTTTNIRREQS